MEIPQAEIDRIKREARQEVASKAGKKGFKANLARIMDKHKFKTEAEAKAWYFKEIGKLGGRPKKQKENNGKY